MRNDSAQPYDEENRTRGDKSSTDPERDRLDLQDSEHDQERLKPDEAILDLPDVKDIPGQEFVHAAPLGELADTTISSADEEGEGLFEDDEEDETDIVMGTEADIPEGDKVALERGEEYMPTRDEDGLLQASLDNSDFEGTPLNEQGFGAERSGSDLDTAVGGDETRSSSLGQGDEENKNYSLGGSRQEGNEEDPYSQPDRGRP